MKYIFTIHSHITFLSALSIVEYEKLDKKQVIFICSYYKPQLKKNSKINIIKSFNELESSYNILQRIINFNYGTGVDKYINKTINDDNFIAYIDLMSVFNRFLVTHPMCEQFHFIEEGSVNYGDFDDFRLLTADLDIFEWRLSYKKHLKEILLSIYRVLRGRSLRILNLPIQPNTYAFFKGVKFYGLSEYSFPNIPKDKRRITSFSMIKSEFKENKKLDLDLNNNYIWIGDTACNYYNISMTHFEDALSKLLNKIEKPKSNRVYIKFRGIESVEERRITEESFKNKGFSVNFIDEKAVMEDIFMNYKNLIVLGNVSSLLIYAKLMGHEVFSIFPYIPNQYAMPFATNFKSIQKLLNYYA